jgi:hypothetical protein
VQRNQRKNKVNMNKEELIESLADKEHASWCRWMQYLFSKSEAHGDGSVTIPASLALRWFRQADTPYAELSEQEKQSDRDEVAHILPVIREYALSQCGDSGEMAAYAWGMANAHAVCIPDLQRQVQILMNEVFCTHADRPATRNQTLLGDVRELRRLVFSYKADEHEAKEYAEGLGQERTDEKTEDLKPLLIAVWRHMLDSERRLDPPTHPDVDPYSTQSKYEPAYVNHCFDLSQRVHDVVGYTPGKHVAAECPLCSGWQ